MPTGYTANISKDISFNEFIMDCARNFGALIMMRDEPSGAPVPEKFEPSDYHSKELVKAQQRLDELHAMTEIQKQSECDDYNKQQIADAERRGKDRSQLKEKYEAMLERVNAWQPPSDDHKWLKDFMQQQITESIRFDCSGNYDSIEKLTVSKWFAKQLKDANWMVSYHKKEEQEEIKRTNNRNRWIKQLRESLI